MQQNDMYAEAAGHAHWNVQTGLIGLIHAHKAANINGKKT